MRFTTFLVCLLCIASNLFSQNDFTKTRESKISEFINLTGKLEKKISNVNFDFISINTDEGYKDVLLEIERDFSIISGSEGFNSKMRLTAYEKQNNSYTNKIWEIKQKADAFEKGINYLKMVQWGGTEDDGYTYYCKQSGKKYCDASSNLTYIEIPNTRNTRIISYLSHSTNLSLDENKQYHDLLGILNYGNIKDIQQRLFIFGDSGGMPWTPIIYIIDKENKKYENHYMHWEGDNNPSKSAISNFTILLYFQEDLTIRIPILLDELDIANIEKSSSVFSDFLVK